LSQQKTTGTVKWFDMSKGYGYIELSNGKEVFVYYQNIADNGLKNLLAGDRVEFDVQHKPSGMVASHVTRV
jgi:CspA family cold shock protein